MVSTSDAAMPKSIHSPRHLRLAELIGEKRKAAGMTQAQVAKAIGRHQPFIVNIEAAQRRVDVVELIALAEIIGFDPSEILAELIRTDR